MKTASERPTIHRRENLAGEAANVKCESPLAVDHVVTSVSVGSLVIEPKPNEAVFGLTRDKWDIIRSGGVNQERQARDTFGGIFAGGAVGLVTLLAPGLRVPWALILLGTMSLVSGICTLVFWARIREARTYAGYARVVAEIEECLDSKGDGTHAPTVPRD
ncbi:MAG TPA: hypothetical protein VNX26_14780 [Candidatus Acidoferrum sp.]|jgi:hypothetical protein|nr:hypothetical protein [Candidatus Acidoferrum sp.]